LRRRFYAIWRDRRRTKNPVKAAETRRFSRSSRFVVVRENSVCGGAGELLRHASTSLNWAILRPNILILHHLLVFIRLD
jgi:hypothetical protein